MQFIPNGPDIPDPLLQAHEDGSVVFFCGAGVSYPADLPGFRGLVHDIYEAVGTKPNEIEAAELEKGRFDIVLGLLEHRVSGERAAVRRVIPSILTPNTRLKGAVTTHQAILRLGRDRKNRTRLVTTNFDRLFEIAAKREGITVDHLAAPYLPVPKHSRWDGVVYLHGHLPKRPTEVDLNRLILTSGDFGLAYLAEGWAARFVSELFRNYVVCFVGYSLDDFVLRYMMDALAADRQLGELSPPAYAFGGAEPSKWDAQRREWEAKGVIPILFDTSNGYAPLHETLRLWSETYRDGITGRERIVNSLALAKPGGSTPTDDFEGRLIWAISDPSGQPARIFADMEPAPSIDWLDALSEPRFGGADYPRFGLPQPEIGDKVQPFSILRRPTPHRSSTFMALVTAGTAQVNLAPELLHLMRWMTLHLDDPRMLLWVADQGGSLHPAFADHIQWALDRAAKLEAPNAKKEREALLARAPNAIPRPLQRTLWKLLIAGLVAPPRGYGGSRHRFRQTKDLQSVFHVRQTLREFLTPRVRISKASRLPLFADDDALEEAESLAPERAIDRDVELASDHAHYLLEGLRNAEIWKQDARTLLRDFESLLADALDLRREVGLAGLESDYSSWHQTSISPHWQDERHTLHDWTLLIDLARDAWLAVLASAPDTALEILRDWIGRPYTTFQRLALFAATQHKNLPDAEWIGWLKDDVVGRFWGSEFLREVMRLLAERGPTLKTRDRNKIQAWIVAGPPREFFVNDLKPEELVEETDWLVWRFLAQLRHHELQLSGKAKVRLANIERRRPWLRDDGERAEFSSWWSGTGAPDYEERIKVDKVPTDRHAIPDWLTQPRQKRDGFFDARDDWQSVCKNRTEDAIGALIVLANRGDWPVNRWSVAFYAWANDDLPRRIWRRLRSTLQTVPDEVLKQLAHPLSFWLESVAKNANWGKSTIIELCRRLIRLSDESEGRMDDPVTEAINHPVGKATGALVSLWFTRKPNDGQGLSRDLKPIFTELCGRERPAYRLARVILASNLIALFRVDRAWTEANLLPSFHWPSGASAPEPNGEAASVWRGFLWSPRLYSPLLKTLEADFFRVAEHVAILDEPGRIYVQFLTLAALEPAGPFPLARYRDAFSRLPSDKLAVVAHWLTGLLKEAGDQRESYWRNRIRPFWVTVWPKDADRRSPELSENLARLCVAAGPAFPEAVELLVTWLIPAQYGSLILEDLVEDALANRYPEAALAVVDGIIDNPTWIHSEFRDVLRTIVESRPTLADDPRYQRLDTLARSKGL